MMLSVVMPPVPATVSASLTTQHSDKLLAQTPGYLWGINSSGTVADPYNYYTFFSGGGQETLWKIASGWDHSTDNVGTGEKRKRLIGITPWPESQPQAYFWSRQEAVVSPERGHSLYHVPLMTSLASVHFGKMWS